MKLLSWRVSLFQFSKTYVTSLQIKYYASFIISAIFSIILTGDLITLPVGISMTFLPENRSFQIFEYLWPERQHLHP